MLKKLTKTDLPDEIITPGTVVRKTKAEDLKEIAAWPAYPPPYHGMSMDAIRREPDGLFWWQQFDHPDRCHYSVVSKTGEILGIHAFARIDWRKGAVRNMGCRIRPDVCDMGYGTETLRLLLAEVMASGMMVIQLDTLADNSRAIRCYEKCGMRIVDMLRDKNLWYNEMEMARNPMSGVLPSETELDKIVATRPEIVTGRLAKFANEGEIEYPIHAFLYAIERTKAQTAYLEILEHTLMNYGGEYTLEESRILKDILRTLSAMDSGVSREIIRKALNRFSEIETPVPETSRLIEICRDGQTRTTNSKHNNET